MTLSLDGSSPSPLLLCIRVRVQKVWTQVRHEYTAGLEYYMITSLIPFPFPMPLNVSPIPVKFSIKFPLRTTKIANVVLRNSNNSRGHRTIYHMTTHSHTVWIWCCLNNIFYCMYSLRFYQLATRQPQHTEHSKVFGRVSLVPIDNKPIFFAFMAGLSKFMAVFRPQPLYCGLRPFDYIVPTFRKVGKSMTQTIRWHR